MNRLKDFDLNASLLLFYIFVLLLVILTGCTSLDKAIKVSTKTEANARATQQALNSKHEKVVAENCADEYPVAESEVIPGAETVTETEDVQTETVPCKDEQGRQIEYVEVPKVRIVTKTVQRVDTIRVRDRAQERAYQLQELETQKALTRETEAHTATVKRLEETTKERNQAYWFGGIMMLLLGGLFFFKVIR